MKSYKKDDMRFNIFNRNLAKRAMGMNIEARYMRNVRGAIYKYMYRETHSAKAQQNYN